MSSDGQLVDYEPVTPARRVRDAGPEDLSPVGKQVGVADEDGREPPAGAEGSLISSRARKSQPVLRRAHALTYVGLFFFTSVLYFRPYEFLPLPITLAFWLAVMTLAVYAPSQLAAEGNLTARPREVNLVLLFCVAALLSIPLAKGSRLAAWNTFTDVFIRAVLMFVVIVNVARTGRRLKGLLLLSLGAGCFLAVGALNNYRSGNFTVEGYRVEGVIGGMFENPNDMALHLVTMIPVAVALLFAARGPLRKIVYGACAAVMVAGTVVTFSRGGFLALVAVAFTLAWALGRKHRAAVGMLALLLTVGFLVLAPGNYTSRILSIFDRDLDAFGSAEARQALLFRSIRVALRNPLFGIGMGNFEFVSIKSQQTHNAYTQVAAEMGLAAMVIYTLFIVAPLRSLRRIVRETLATRRGEQFYYLAIGLQASLVGYLVASFFASVAYYWNVYYLVGYAVCLRRLYEANVAGTGGAPAGERDSAPHFELLESGPQAVAPGGARAEA